MKSKPTLFVLEDSNEILADIRLIIQSLNAEWTLKEFTSIDQAMNAMALCNGDGISAIMLDIMLPKDQAHFKEVSRLSDTMDKKRLELNAIRDAAERQRALAELRTIDKTIRGKTIFDGGVRFIEDISSNGWLKASTKVAFFSALNADTNPDSKKSLGERIRDTLKRDADKWFPKPADPVEIEEWLNGLAEE